MGRKNYESIGRPLPGRESYVVTRNPDWSAAGVRTFASVDAALDAAVATGRDVWVFGGGEIYAAAWARTTWLEITEVDLAVPGGCVFPPPDRSGVLAGGRPGAARGLLLGDLPAYGRGGLTQLRSRRYSPSMRRSVGLGRLRRVATQPSAS